MPTTRINVDAVEESTARALRFVSEQQDALNAIARVVDTMEEAWDSDAQRAYAESFQQSRQQIERFNESVNDSLNNMRNFVTDCVNVDELTAREIRNVSW
ncbi:MAG: WXG100 family type VII secretion target [Synergistaceae bacterium]|nr:WXG100 family type VII secretion target [Synergistaceae bacterium]